MNWLVVCSVARLLDCSIARLLACSPVTITDHRQWVDNLRPLSQPKFSKLVLAQPHNRHAAPLLALGVSTMFAFRSLLPSSLSPWQTSNQLFFSSSPFFLHDSNAINPVALRKKKMYIYMNNVARAEEKSWNRAKLCGSSSSDC